MNNWSKKKKIGMGFLALFIVLCIVAAIVTPIEFCTRLGETSSWMWSKDQDFSMLYTDWKKEIEEGKRTVNGETSLNMNSVAPYAVATLRKDPNKDFVILNFTDTQVDLPSNFSKTGKIYKTMKKVIEQSKPDLITFSGDQAWFPPTRQSYAELARVMDGFKIPWTFAFGNHDHQGNSDLNYLVEVAQKSKYCLIDKGPRNVTGVGNCFINIVEKQDNGKDKIVHTVILLDTGDSGYDYTEEQTYYDADPITEDDITVINQNIQGTAMKEALGDCTMDFNKYPFLKEIIEENKENPDDVRNKHIGSVKVGKSYSTFDISQIEWYKWVLQGNQKVNEKNGFENAMPESTCVFHIAFNEFYDAYKQWLTAIKNNDVEGVKAMQAEGRMRMDEAIGSGTYNPKMFSAMIELGSTKNVIIGHDHVNDFSLVYQGIRLTYGVKTGSKCYWEEDGSMNGGTKLTIGNGGTATSLKQVYIDDYMKK